MESSLIKNTAFNQGLWGKGAMLIKGILCLNSKQIM